VKRAQNHKAEAENQERVQSQMALFFDQDWFRTRLEEVGQSHDAMAAAAGLTLGELAAVWKDQREITVANVEAFAQLLGKDPKEVASRCGVSTLHTPDPVTGAHQDKGLRSDAQGFVRLEEKIDDILSRLRRMEEDMAVLRSLLLTKNNEQE
jgi:malonyl CoA-acyl carrier protein transacylase